VAGWPVLIFNGFKILGVTLNQHLIFNDHVQSVWKSAQHRTRALRHIRSSLTADGAKTVSSTLIMQTPFVVAHLSIIWRNYNETRTPLLESRYVHWAHIRPVLQKRHWLPFRNIIDSKRQQLRSKFHKLSARRTWLASTVIEYSPTRQLRSSSSLLLQLPSTRAAMARRAFSQAAPRVWNDLPTEIRNYMTSVDQSTSNFSKRHTYSWNQ